MKRLILALLICLAPLTAFGQQSGRVVELMSGYAQDSTDDFSAVFDCRTAGFTSDTKGTFSRLVTDIAWNTVGDSLSVSLRILGSVNQAMWRLLDSSATIIASADSILATDNILSTSIVGYPYLKFEMLVYGRNDLGTLGDSGINAYTVRGFFSR